MATFQFRNGKLIRTEKKPRNGYELALRMISGKMTLVKVRDSSGHEHDSDNGQFTSGSGGGSGGDKPGEDKPKHGDRHAALKEQHEAFKKQRQEHFNELKADAAKAKGKADSHWSEVSEHVDNIAAVHGTEEPDDRSDDNPDYAKWEANETLANAYNELEELKGADPETPAELFQHFKDVEDAAKQLLEANKDVKPGTGDDELTAEELAENKKRARAVIAACKAGREHLRAYSQHRKEMKEIKELR